MRMVLLTLWLERVPLVFPILFHFPILIPSLSNKLMSIGQATEQLNCCVLIYPTFYFLQDILTKEIIGRGAKRGGFTM